MIMLTSPKTEDQYFCDWEGEIFGYGYGTGEGPVLVALHQFMSAIPERTYDYTVLETACGDTVAWLLINALCKNGDIDYGVSSRFGWLSPGGELVRAYVLSKTPEELTAIVSHSDNDTYCYKSACNCGPNGYEESRICPNPFWGRKP